MPLPYTVSIVAIRDWGGDSQSMKATDTGSAFVPHHIVDDVSLPPVTSGGALDDLLQATMAAACLYNADTYFDLDGYFVIYDSAVAPPLAMTPKKIFKVYADQHFSYSPPKPIQCANGIVLAFVSSIANAFAYVSGGNHAFFSAEVGAFTGEAS